MRIILGLIGCIVSVYIGYIFSKKYIERKKYYKDFFYFNKNLYNQVSFNQSTLINVIKEKNDDSYFNTLLKEAIICKKKDITLSDNYSKDDQEFFIEYVSNLGTSDYTTQRKYLTEIDNILQKKLLVIF